MSNQEWRVIVKRTNDSLKWQKIPNTEVIESHDSSRDSGQPVEKPPKWPTYINSASVGSVGTSSVENSGTGVARSTNYSSKDNHPTTKLLPLNTNYLRPPSRDLGLNSFKRRFSHDEREVHKVALNKARKQALTELQLPKEWIENKLEELMYKIDPRTQTPASGFFESFQRLRKFNYELQTKTKINTTNNQIELADVLKIDNHEFSREHFYLNNYFQIALVDYYWNLLKTEQTYHSVKVIYHQKKPHLKIGFQDTRK